MGRGYYMSCSSYFSAAQYPRGRRRQLTFRSASFENASPEVSAEHPLLRCRQVSGREVLGSRHHCGLIGCASRTNQTVCLRDGGIPQNGARCTNMNSLGTSGNQLVKGTG